LSFDVTAPANPPYGWHESTQEAAMANFKAAYAAVGGGSSGGTTSTGHAGA
jgi:hypothetical protein